MITNYYQSIELIHVVQEICLDEKSIKFRYQFRANHSYFKNYHLLSDF